MEYYLKKLAKNELGLKADGTVARGRFIYVSKSCAGFFPYLSKVVTNDNVLIPIIPPFTDSKIYSTFVYHNDSLNTPDGTRDEYRLYLNQDLDPGRDYFKENDILVFEKVNTSDMRGVYILYRYQIADLNYSYLQSLINDSPINGGHALVEEQLAFLPSRDINIEESDVVIPAEVQREVFQQQEEALAAEDAQIEDIRGATLFGSDSFRDFVLLAYEYRCAITNVSIQHNKLNNLEAAHIQPRAHTGTFLPCNGIALSRDMHWAFDKGLFTISDDYEIIVHDAVATDSLLNSLNRKKIRVPKEPYFQPERKFLKYHRENIFGLFLYSGSIRTQK
jgi:hypothetical protein